MFKRVGCIGSTKSHRLQCSSQFRLEQYYKQDRNNVKQPVKKEAYHVESDKTAERNENKDEYDYLYKLSRSCLSDKQKNGIKQECNKDDVHHISDEIPRAAEKQRTPVKAVKKLAYEFKYLADERSV